MITPDPCKIAGKFSTSSVERPPPWLLAWSDPLASKDSGRSRSLRQPAVEMSFGFGDWLAARNCKFDKTNGRQSKREYESSFERLSSDTLVRHAPSMANPAPWLHKKRVYTPFRREKFRQSEITQGCQGPGVSPSPLNMGQWTRKVCIHELVSSHIAVAILCLNGPFQ